MKSGTSFFGYSLKNTIFQKDKKINVGKMTLFR